MRSETPNLNAFDLDFLEELDRLDEPETAAEADTAGPWTVQEMPRGAGWGVFRLGQSAARGDDPVGVFRRREKALAAAAVLPGTGRERRLRLNPEAEDLGYALEGVGGEVEGYLRLFDENLRDALHVADALLRSPESLARFLEAAGGLALRETGRLLRREVEENLEEKLEENLP